MGLWRAKYGVTNQYVDKPQKIAENVKSFQVKGNFACLIKSDDSFWVATRKYSDWGGTGFIKLLENVSEASCFNMHILILQKNGSLWSFGNNDVGQLGVGERIVNPSAENMFDRDRTETPLSVMNDVVHVAAGGGHSLALKQDGSVWVWGTNGSGQIGNGAGLNTVVFSPEKVLEDAKSIYAWNDYSVAIKKDNSLWVWGKLPDGRTQINGASKRDIFEQ